MEGVYKTLPFKFGGNPIRDYKDALIIPGFTDLHVHAPQYSYRGLGMDMELLEWLETNTFPEESKFCDLDYAEKSYRIFVKICKRVQLQGRVYLRLFTGRRLFCLWICLNKAG